jgi:excisionase family DNA binding protein
MAVDTLMQVRQAARYLGVHENTLRRWEKNGLVRAVRLPSGVRRFRVDEVERLRAEIYGGAGSESSRSYHDSLVSAAKPRVEA